MVMTGEGLGDLESVGSIGAADAHSDAGVAQLSQVAIRVDRGTPESTPWPPPRR